MWYLALLIIAIWANKSDWESLFLTLVIGASAYAVIPLEMVTDRNLWFMLVFFADMFIIYIACFLRTPSAIPIIGLSGMLCIGHLIDWRYSTDPIYYQIANWLEYLEIVCCIIFSPVALNFIRKKIHNAY